jgi:DNA-binding HxlR family transcriptional regulator
LDVLGRRWSLRVLWELRASAASFRELQARCDGLSPTVLNVRLKELREVELVELTPTEGYRLTNHGDTIVGALGPLERVAGTVLRRGKGAR